MTENNASTRESDASSTLQRSIIAQFTQPHHRNSPRLCGRTTTSTFLEMPGWHRTYFLLEFSCKNGSCKAQRPDNLISSHLRGKVLQPSRQVARSHHPPSDYLYPSEPDTGLTHNARRLALLPHKQTNWPQVRGWQTRGDTILFKITPSESSWGLFYKPSQPKKKW